jgi:hypothetical protein
MNRRYSSRWLAILAAIALLAAPLLEMPAAAGVADSPVAHAADAGHDHHHSAQGAVVDDGGTCTPDHHASHGNCCATCAQCFTAAFSGALTADVARAVQAPTVRYLDSQVLPSGHDRPPRSA